MTVVVAVSLIALIAASALAIDLGLVWAARNQVQNVADATALAAASSLIDIDAPAVTLAAAETSALDVGSAHGAIGVTSMVINPGDISYGNWDLATRTFDGGVDLTDPNVVNAVAITARLDGAANGPVTAVMSRVLGRQSFPVIADATAYIGYAGRVGPGNIDLPIAIDCCKLAGSDCEQDYCQTIATNPPNPCSLDDPQDPDSGDVTCLEFHNTSDQNACWTSFDGYSPSVNTPDLRDLAANGVDEIVDLDGAIYVDNGDKTPVIGTISDRFSGEGGFTGSPAGVDRYPPIYDPPVSDSWVVGLPVVECQSQDHCAGGNPTKMVGFVCFELREIEVTPGKIIRGRFLCPTDPLYDECDLGTTTSGGLNFGIRADIPVLVQ